MLTLAIVNQKGGSGKTATAVNIAAALGEIGKKVLVHDLDSQRSASRWLGNIEAGEEALELFTSKKPLTDFVLKTEFKGVDLIPSSKWLVGLEKATANQAGAELMLKYKYSSIPDEWDYVLFDCPPALGLVTRAALAAVQHIFVPVETHYMALSGLADLIETYDWVKEVMNPQISIYGILPCRVNLRTRNAQEVINELRSNFGELVFNTLIRENVRIAESPSHHKPITAYDDRSYGAEDYRAAAKEFVSRHKKMSEVKSNAK